MTAYAGRYTLTGDEVIHHVEAASMPNDVGTDLKRLVKLDGDQLVLLVAKPYLRGGMMVCSQELIWKRFKSVPDHGVISLARCRVLGPFPEDAPTGSGPDVWLSFPRPAHRTGGADLPRPALGEDSRPKPIAQDAEQGSSGEESASFLTLLASSE